MTTSKQRDFVDDLLELRATLHVVQNDTCRRSAIDRLTRRRAGYEVSRRTRKRTEEVFGRGKEIGPIRKTKFSGKERTGFQLLLTQAGYNVIRLCDIITVTPPGQEGCL